MKLIVLALLGAMLTGCTAADYVRSSVAERGAEVADRLADDSLWYLCSGMPIGAWQRRFGRDAALGDAWWTLCESPDLAPPVDAQ